MGVRVGVRVRVGEGVKVGVWVAVCVGDGIEVAVRVAAIVEVADGGAATRGAHPAPTSSTISIKLLRLQNIGSIICSNNLVRKGRIMTLNSILEKVERGEIRPGTVFAAVVEASLLRIVVVSSFHLRLEHNNLIENWTRPDKQSRGFVPTTAFE